MTAAIAAYEASAEVNPFSSKFDASKHWNAAAVRYAFLRHPKKTGDALFLNKAQCFRMPFLRDP
jgi:cytochrome c peroxidase